MKNKAAWIVFIFIILILGSGLAYRLIYITNHPPVYIAAFVPGGEGGDTTTTENTLVPIQMYLDEINAKGGINGHPLKLVVKEDKGTAAGAEQAISEINAENKAMIVLGHAYSDPASAIGSKLTEYGIPAIASGATAPQVTIDHPWFFRVVTNNTSQGKSIAAYAIEVLGIETAAIIYEDNKYGQSLGDGFEKSFQALGGTVFTKAAVDSESETLEQDVTNIVMQIDEVPDMVFLATYKASGAATVIALKENNVNTIIVGGDDIGDTAFLGVFPDEIQQDIHYLDNIYAASPLIFDVASEEAQLFKERYIDQTDRTPTWYCATSYDSALTAVQAMVDAGISADPEQLTADRQKVRDQLAKYNSSSTAIHGITGNLFFDKTNDVVQPAAIGIFTNQNFISAPIQIQLIKHNTQVDNISESLAKGDLFYINGQPVYKTKIVYVGTDINEFSQIDIDDEHIFTVDFYLWFRYTGDLEIENIVFDNVEEPIELELIKTAQYGDVTYKLYRAKATFSGSYNLFQYPFDRHKLHISFRHPDYDRHQVIFVADQLGMGDINNTETLLATFEQSRAFDPITDWFPVTGSFFQDVIHEYTNRGDPTLFGQKLDIQYSRFNITVEVRRDVVRFLTKTMLPLLFLITLAYLGFFLPGNQFEAITGLMTGTLLSVVFFHVDLSGRLRVGYTVIQDYLFYIIYGMLTVELFLSIIAWHKQDDEKAVKRLFWSMRIIYPLAIVLGSVIVLWAFRITI